MEHVEKVQLSSLFARVHLSVISFIRQGLGIQQT